MPEQIFGYYVHYQCEKMVGCIKAKTEEEARNKLRAAYNVPESVKISVKPQKFNEDGTWAGIWEIYYGG